MSSHIIFTLEQAADYAQVHPQTLYRLVRSGEIPAKKIGREWRIHRDILDSYVKGTLVVNESPKD